MSGAPPTHNTVLLSLPSMCSAASVLLKSNWCLHLEVQHRWCQVRYHMLSGSMKLIPFQSPCGCAGVIKVQATPRELPRAQQSSGMCVCGLLPSFCCCRRLCQGAGHTKTTATCLTFLWHVQYVFAAVVLLLQEVVPACRPHCANCHVPNIPLAFECAICCCRCCCNE
jgi:hypothetical protein